VTVCCDCVHVVGGSIGDHARPPSSSCPRTFLGDHGSRGRYTKATPKLPSPTRELHSSPLKRHNLWATTPVKINHEVGPRFPHHIFLFFQVTVEDVDECALDPASPQGTCPGCRPHCHQHAKCENRVGTYACKCPKCMSGDGTTPAGYEGGTGCRDVCAPVITLIGGWMDCGRVDGGGCPRRAASQLARQAGRQARGPPCSRSLVMVGGDCGGHWILAMGDGCDQGGPVWFDTCGVVLFCNSSRAGKYL